MKWEAQIDSQSIFWLSQQPKPSHSIHGEHKLMTGIITILIPNTANKQAKKKKKHFSLLFVEMLRKFTND